MYRYFARFIIEAESPIAIGGDTLEFSQDTPVEKDFNGLPCIPGTALTGAFREGLALSFESLFGNTESSQPQGSNLVFSDALLYDGERVVEELDNEIFSRDYYKWFQELPIRPHAKHDHKGATIDGGLFDQEVVYKGSRFKFEIVLESETAQNELWEKFLKEAQAFHLFLGAGQYKGYGLCKVIDIKIATCSTYDEYLNLSPSLNDDIHFTSIDLSPTATDWQVVELNTTNTLFHYGAGYGDDEVDAVCYQEMAICWNEGIPEEKECFVIPASSTKGPIAHRVAFHHNKEQGVFSSKSISLDKVIGEGNSAVKNLFGSAKNSKTNQGQRGKVIFKDYFIPVENTANVTLMHNTIDRFTGGTLDGALFSEKAFHVEHIKIEYIVEPIQEVKLLDKALEDIKNGTLPIGGMSAKGHGIINSLAYEN